MAGTFDLKRLLGQVSKRMFRRYLAARQVELDVDWEKLPGKRYGQKLFEAWLNLESAQVRRLEPELMDVSNLAQERGVSGVIQAAAEMGADLQQELDAHESLADRILHVMIEHPRLWRNIQHFVELDLLATKRHWNTYPGLPAMPIVDLEGKLDALKNAVGEFQFKLDGRGRKRKIEYRMRNGRIDYFFIYLDSYVHTERGWHDDGEIGPQRLQPVLDVVFVFHRESGTVELMAQGGKKVTKPLLAIFCREMLEVDPPDDSPERHPYQLGSLLDPQKEFPVEPADGIEAVYLQALKLAMTGQGGRRITLEGDLERDPRDVYHMMADLFRDGPAALRDYRVVSAKFKVRFDSRGPIAKRSKTFKLSYPNGDDFKDESEQVRDAIQRCLRRWEIDESQPAEELVAAGASA